MFLNILIKPKKVASIIFVIVLVSVILTIINMIIGIDEIKNGTRLKHFDINMLNNYYTEYDMTIVSNKNTNTYSVKEWHKEGVSTKLEYLDYMKNKVTITLENNTCYIENSGNLAKLVVDNTHNNKNISSLSTFGYLYNLINGSCSCTKNVYEKDGETVIRIEFSKSGTCEPSSFANNLKLSMLELIVVNNGPKNYIIYDENKNPQISIVYNKFEIIN